LLGATDNNVLVCTDFNIYVTICLFILRA